MDTQFSWQFDADHIDWHALAHLYRIAPLGNKTPEGLFLAYSNSMFKCIVSHDSQYIGAGRVLADGVDCAYICDVAIHPDYQGAGLGKPLFQNYCVFQPVIRKLFFMQYQAKRLFTKN